MHISEVDDFCVIRSANSRDVDSLIGNSDKTSNYLLFCSQKQIKLIELAAFSKSIGVFLNLILNHAEANDSLIDKKHCEVTLHTIEFTIRYYQNNVFIWLFEKNKDLVEKNISDFFFELNVKINFLNAFD